eukprot:TRINITY_DN10739_c0_g1_i1.p1 TRINITY_DN10739_c0_g1~~TRINITY_DN10739_c0_g1_i1.p1  ORF type:complete len:174 (+),score=38.26 TRINITY_DN10739_c0_g1_i1:228-749(+)
MFFRIALTRKIYLHPRHFGPGIRDTIKRKLHDEVEGTCSGRYGFVVAVTSVEDIGSGIVQDGTGFTLYHVSYMAIVFKPFKFEVLDSEVSEVNKMGFMAKAGPLSIFVSKHLIPDDMIFDPHTAAYVCDDADEGDIRISKGDQVRVKVAGIKVDANDIFCVGTINEDWLGCVS